MTAQSRDQFFFFSWIFKSCLILLLGWGLLPTARALADSPAAVQAGGLSQQDAQQLLNVLNDPQKRAEFSKTLSLMAKGLPAARPGCLQGFCRLQRHTCGHRQLRALGT